MTPPHRGTGDATAHPVRVVIADDNAVVRAGLAALLSGRQEEVTVVAEAADGREAYERTLRTAPDVVLLDVRMPGADGISALPHLVPLAPVLMLTYSRENDTVYEALRRGASGYLVHGEFTADQLVDAIGDVRAGRAHFSHSASAALLANVRGEAGSQADPPRVGSLQTQSDVSHSVEGGLSRREGEIMELIGSGMTNHQIAAACFISRKTVKNHINRIFAKLHASNRAEAIALWRAGRGGRAGPP